MDRLERPVVLQTPERVGFTSERERKVALILFVAESPDLAASDDGTCLFSALTVGMQFWDNVFLMPLLSEIVLESEEHICRGFLLLFC